jgi:L-seryl-tRNA(Ser) seleniumtransferase
MLTADQQNLLRTLPGVDHVLELARHDGFFDHIPKSVLLTCIRDEIDAWRKRILEHGREISPDQLSDAAIIDQTKQRIRQALSPNLRPVVNAAGVVVHTNLGRSLLARKAVENLVTIAGRYSNLEYNLQAGQRGSRYSNVDGLLCEITGAQSAMVVNNNAAAVLLCLDTLARDRSVIVSRGELVEIGGSFRIPDVMAKSGAILREVGTTNRTHPRDYGQAIDASTALLLKVHKSNYSIVGFTAEVSLKELVEIGATHHVPVMEDLGSGNFVDLSKYGLMREPTVQESVAVGADVVTFSGDKLLGGPQAGLIVGKKEFVDRIKKNPLTRALRIDKLTLAALETTLGLYRDEAVAVRDIPTLRMLTLSPEEVDRRARLLTEQLTRLAHSRLHLGILDRPSRAGGGALPLLQLPSRCVSVRVDGLSSNRLETALRQNVPPIIARIEDDLLLLDFRTLLDDDIPVIVAAIDTILTHTEK